MELKIDLKKESKEDIKKLISFLQKFIDEYPSYSPEPSQGAFNMFGSDNSSESEDSLNNASSGMDMFSNDSSYTEKEDEEKEPEQFNVHDMLEQY